MIDVTDPHHDHGLCPNEHPYGVKYRLQHFAFAGDENIPESPSHPRAVLCPWCDWVRLRGNGSSSAHGSHGARSDVGALLPPRPPRDRAAEANVGEIRKVTLKIPLP